MPADFQRAVLHEVVPAVRAGRVRGESIDIFLVAKLKDCLGNPDADMAKAIRIPGALEPVTSKRLAEVKNLTEGARQLVQKSRGLNEALSYIFRDKDFRAYLRSSISAERLKAPLNQAISALSALPTDAAPSAQAAPQAGAPAKTPAPAKPLPAATPPAATHAKAAAQLPPPAAPRPPRPQGANGALAGYFDHTFPYRFTKGEERVGSIVELADLLADPDGVQRLSAQMAGVVASDRPQLLILLDRLVKSGQVEATPEAASLLKVFAARVYLQLNAVESAAKLAGELLVDGAGYRRLPEGEQLRLRNLLARCALRSGRPNEAVELYCDILADNPGSPGALMNVVGSAFAVDPELARRLAKIALLNNYAVSDGDLTFIGDILSGHGDFEQAEAAFFRILQKNAGYFDGYIGLANVHLARGDRANWQRYLRRYFQTAGGLDIQLDPHEPVVPFALRQRPLPRITEHPRVTIVMTTFNSGPTVDRAIDSVLNQVLANIELIVVDDVSEDDSRARVMEIARRDPRVRWIHNEENVGTYVSKNKGIAVCTGEYVTFHDSDDWMHPRRLADHLEKMKAGFACTTSNWLRMDVGGHAIVRRGGPYTHLNPASTFMPRSLFESLGPFDAVRTGADSEIVSRIRMSYGQKSVNNLQGCLGIGLHHENSLTQSGVAAFDEFRYSPVRLDYTERWLAWQLGELTDGPKELQLLHDGRERKFSIPEALAPR